MPEVQKFDEGAADRLNERVRAYWENEPCGTAGFIVGDLLPGSKEWYERMEALRYEREPEIHATAQFTRHHGKTILEIGVGAGTDHLQWARAGAVCHGVDLTDAAVDVTRQRLALYGFTSDLQRCDAEKLPFEDASFDVVYSWGVIHHAESPALIVAEIHRILKPGGVFLGMLYGRHSPLVFKVWFSRALLRGRPWLSLRRVVYEHVESIGTKAYTPGELRGMFSAFTDLKIKPLRTYYDKLRWPGWVAEMFPDRLGWFITVKATK
jgi:ubiquinone/menaquinone biosynthesis C-methylase UbiE